MKLKAKDVKVARSAFLKQQQYKCAICGYDCTEEQAVLDHDHKGGHIRAVLHRGCNALLGRIENNAPRHGLKTEQLINFLTGAARYIDVHQENRTGLIHPTHKTAEEKEIARKAKAKRKREQQKRDKLKQ
jgi:hypothetical protein